VLSLVPMAPSAWRYYAEEIATGREDYYALAAERPGRFLGRGAAALGIADDEVSALGLERLFGHGLDPRDGIPLGRSFSADNPRAVAGFALTFSAPKTVSVLWAVGDAEIAQSVADAHDAAVAASMAFLEDHAAFTRRSHNGVLQVDTDGLVAASFVHRTSRASDPQLHTHVLVANKVRAKDGSWLSLDARELFECQKAAGMLYKAALRVELSRTLGVAWTTVDDNGIAEIVGVPDTLVTNWSARRQELKALGDELIAKRSVELGRSLRANERAECFQIAAYRTRTPKVDADTPTTELRERWRSEALSWGEQPERWISRVTARQKETAELSATEVVPTVLARLEDRAATWGRADVVEEVTRLVDGPDADSLRRKVEALADEVLRSGAVVCLAGPLPAEPPASLRREDGMAACERHGAVRFTTTDTLQREAEILEAAATGAHAEVAVVPRSIAKAVLTSSGLGEDQRRAVLGLLGGGERIALLVGPAGAGKSRALDAARRGWEAAGCSTIGSAPSAMAASVLTEEAGLRTETLAKFLLDLEGERAGATAGLDARSVVILDEAGMARTDDLQRLVRAVVEADAKLVLVGDPNQLGAVGPGGVFRTLVEDRGANELETVRRFHHAWEAAASLRLRARDTSILPAYARHDRIEDGSREEMLERSFQAWRAARDEGSAMLLMTGDNASAEQLSRRCRAELVRRGEVEERGVQISSGVVGVGDEIVTLRNDRRLRPTVEDFVRNGERFKVAVAFGNGALLVDRMHGAGSVTLPADYVAEHVALGYALTVHKAQGQTTDLATVLVDETMTAAQLYVAMSRGREENRALVITSDDAPEDHVRRPTLDAIETLATVMRRDGIDRSAHDVMRAGFRRFDDTELLSNLWAEAGRYIEEHAGPDRRREIEALAAKANVAEAGDALRRAEESARWAEKNHLEAEQRVAELEREPMRARLPGRLGADKRDEHERVRSHAKFRLDETLRFEQKDLRRLEAARHRLSDAEEAARELQRLSDAQTRRETWLEDHPEEVRWSRELISRLGGHPRARREGGSTDEGEDLAPGVPPSRVPKATSELEVSESPARAAGRVEAEYSRPDRRTQAWERRGYVMAPEPPPTMDIGGPSLRP